MPRKIVCAVPRNISFALTTAQFLDGSKDVTRRLGWEFLEPGDVLCAVKKCMGLRKGEKLQRLGYLVVTGVRREPLNKISMLDVVREGFPGWGRRRFIEFFCEGHKGCRPDTVITRIEFRKTSRRR